jgi:ABC-type nitrate/sulfonate/bicarbonate transport system substrate-binding protein
LMERNTPAALWMVNGWIATRAWADRNADTVRRFSAAIRAASRWANTHVAETVPIVSKYTKLPEATIKGIMPHPWIETLQPALIQPVLDTSASYGLLSKTFPARDILYVER